MAEVKKTTSAGDPEATLARRVEKEWRHEDLGLTATYGVCRMVATIQAAFIPVSASLIGNSPECFIRMAFAFLVIFSLCSIAGAIYIPVMLADYHRYSSWYYGITGSGTAYPADFDEENNEQERRKKKEAFNCWSNKISWFHFVSFIASSGLFFVIVVNRH